MKRQTTPVRGFRPVLW